MLFFVFSILYGKVLKRALEIPLISYVRYMATSGPELQHQAGSNGGRCFLCDDQEGRPAADDTSSSGVVLAAVVDAIINSSSGNNSSSSSDNITSASTAVLRSELEGVGSGGKAEKNR